MSGERLAVGTVRETHEPRVPALVHGGWRSAFPWLVQGTTARGTASRVFDLGLFSRGSPSADIHRNWGRLLATTAMPAAVHARQVHEAEVRLHESSQPGLRIVEPCDGHVTDRPGLLLAVSTADCVPAFVVDPRRRAVAVVHAGWRGTAAGVLERALQRMSESFASAPEALHVHFGPAICGACYEVGAEVHRALGKPAPPRPTPLDLRAALVERAESMGVDPAHMSVSEHCTQCTRSGLFSHRRGHAARQVGYIGIRP